METTETTADFVADEDEELPETFEETEELPLEAPPEILDRAAPKTEIEPFDELKKAVRGWVDGELSVDEVRTRWLAWDADLGARYHFFEEGLRFQEWSEELIGRGREAFEQFEWIQEQMQRLESSLAEGNALEAAYSVEQMHLSVLRLQGLYAELEAQQKALPVFSESPMLAELIRVGQLAAEQKIPLESFDERLQVYADLQERMRMGLAVLPGAPRERAVLEAERGPLEEAFAVQERGLALLREFVVTGERGLLDQGFEGLEQALQTLNQVRQKLNGALEVPESLPCPYCSASNERGARFCASCQARLPEIADALMDVATAADSPDLPANLQKLGDAVQQRLAGQIGDAELADTVRWFKGLHARAQQQLSAVKPAPANTPPDQVQLLEHARANATEGLQKVEAGLHMLEQFLDHPGDAQLLTDGWEAILGGTQLLTELQALFQQALRS